MQKGTFIICCLLFLGIGQTLAQNETTNNSASNQNPFIAQAVREYSIVVFERPSDSPLALDRDLSTGRLGDGLVDRVFDNYRETFAGKLVNLSSFVLSSSIQFIAKSFNQENENKYNWYNTVQKEMSFTKKLPMQTEISDFYRKTSHIGALDPNEMMFDGFGCRQYITYEDADGNWKKILVFEVACSLDDSETGKQRILHHGKFEMKVDSIKFNPYLCDLPNDSLTVDQVNESLRIPFDFKRRKNLSFRLDASITSSWMNEAIEIFKDQNLGQFRVEFLIPDSTALDTIGDWKGYFTYRANSKHDLDNPKKKVMVSGECYIVPRSFVGNYKENSMPDSPVSPMWGTGQYRLDMQLTETCQMNDEYYKSENVWKEEWKTIKKRKSGYPLLSSFWEQFKNEFDLHDHQWIYTILDPVQSVIIVDETKWLDHIIVGDKDDGL